MLTFYGNIVGGKKLHNPLRRAGNDCRITSHQPSHVIGMEAVNILRRIDQFHDALLVDLRRKRKLNENTVNVRASVQIADHVLKELLRTVRAEGMQRHFNVRLLTCPDFVADINLTCRIVAYGENRQRLALVRIRTPRFCSESPIKNFCHLSSSLPDQCSPNCCRRGRSTGWCPAFCPAYSACSSDQRTACIAHARRYTSN